MAKKSYNFEDLQALVNFVPEDPEDPDWLKVINVCEYLVPGFRITSCNGIWTLDIDLNELIDVIL